MWEKTTHREGVLSGKVQGVVFKSWNKAVGERISIICSLLRTVSLKYMSGKIWDLGSSFISIPDFLSPDT